MNLSYNTESIIMLVIGLAIYGIIKNRQFNRRGPGGLQHFRNFFLAVFIQLIEWVITLSAYMIMFYAALRLISQLAVP